MSDPREYAFVHDWRLDGVRWSTPDDCIVVFTTEFWEDEEDDPPVHSAVLALYGVSDARFPLGAARSRAVYTVYVHSRESGCEVHIQFSLAPEPFVLQCERYAWLRRPDAEVDGAANISTPFP